jgi:hypothetical protein
MAGTTVLCNYTVPRQGNNHGIKEERDSAKAELRVNKGPPELVGPIGSGGRSQGMHSGKGRVQAEPNEKVGRGN